MAKASQALRVMHVVLALDPGGTERLVVDMVRAGPTGFHSLVCCLDARGLWGRELQDEGFVVEELHRASGFRPSLALQIHALIDRHQVDVLHCHHYTPFVYGQLAAILRPRLRVVFTEHGRLTDAPPSRKRALVNPLLGRLPHRIYAVSEDLRRHMIGEGLPAARIGVIYNGIALPDLPSLASRAAARARLGIDEHAPVIGTVGRIDPVKNFDLLLQAFARVARRHPAARLAVVGDGPDLPRLKASCTNAGLDRSVLLTGYRSDVSALMPAFDVYANSSVHEGVSLTILEAMAARLPVVATAVGGTPEVVESGLTGTLVQSRDVAAFASALETLLENPQARARLGAAGRQRVEQRFTSEGMIARYRAAYRESGAASAAPATASLQ